MVTFVFVCYIYFILYMHMYFGRWSGLFGNSEPYTLIFHDSKFSVEIHLYVCIYIF